MLEIIQNDLNRIKTKSVNIFMDFDAQREYEKIESKGDNESLYLLFAKKSKNEILIHTALYIQKEMKRINNFEKNEKLNILTNLKKDFMNKINIEYEKEIKESYIISFEKFKQK